MKREKKYRSNPKKILNSDNTIQKASFGGQYKITYVHHADRKLEIITSFMYHACAQQLNKCSPTLFVYVQSYDRYNPAF